ncbi:MAG: hypothetical protein ABH823_02445 [bacterium]
MAIVKGPGQRPRSILFRMSETVPQQPLARGYVSSHKPGDWISNSLQAKLDAGGAAVDFVLDLKFEVTDIPLGGPYAKNNLFEVKLDGENLFSVHAAIAQRAEASTVRDLLGQTGNDINSWRAQPISTSNESFSNWIEGLITAEQARIDAELAKGNG